MLKKVKLLGVLLLVSTIMLRAQDNGQQSQKEVNPNAPEIQFDKLVHDYGKIKQNSDGTCEFTFKNVGKEPLILSNVRSSCGCTTPYWPKEPIMPGKTEKIKVTYATNRLGVFNKQITIFSNAKNDVVVLTIKGEVLSEPVAPTPEQNKDTK